MLALPGICAPFWGIVSLAVRSTAPENRAAKRAAKKLLADADDLF